MSGYAIHPCLRDRHVFVTGGAAGIGAAIVEAFYRQQSRVSFVDIDSGAAGVLVDRLGDSGPTAPVFECCDLRDVEHLQRIIGAAARTHGPIRVLVNNAANDDRHRVEDVAPDYWDDRLAVNLRHVFFAAQAVAPQMRAAGGGSIVNLGSMHAHVHTDEAIGYTASKHAIRGVTQTLAKAWGKHGIRVNTVVPGWVMTERQLAMWVDQEAERRIDANQCLGGRVQPDDVARMVLFLASDDSAMCTAQDYIVDAGWVNH